MQSTSRRSRRQGCRADNTSQPTSTGAGPSSRSEPDTDAQFARVQRGGARDVLARKEVWQYFLSARGTYCDVANCDRAQDLVGRGQARSAGVDYERAAGIYFDVRSESAF